MDITTNNFHIANIFNVITSVNYKSFKTPYPEGRYSDAFIYIQDGSCTYIFDDGTTFTANKGDIFYLSHNSVYYMDIHTESYHAIFCDFLFAENCKKKSIICTPKTDEAEKLFKKLIRIYTISANDSFCKCMSTLYDIYSILKTETNANYIKHSTRQKIEIIKNYIDSDYKNENMTVVQLATKAGMSEVHFRKLFKATYSIAPSQYIINVRLKEAIRLMGHPFLNLEDCASQSGFSSLAYFSRVFKNRYGVSPLKYRKEKYS